MMNTSKLQAQEIVPNFDQFVDNYIMDNWEFGQPKLDDAGLTEKALDAYGLIEDKAFEIEQLMADYDCDEEYNGYFFCKDQEGTYHVVTPDLEIIKTDDKKRFIERLQLVALNEDFLNHPESTPEEIISTVEKYRGKENPTGLIEELEKLGWTICITETKELKYLQPTKVS